MKLRKTTMLKVAVRVLFVSAPMILLSGYLVYLLRNWLASSNVYNISEPVYLGVLMLVMWGAMWLTTGQLLKDLKKESKGKLIESKAATKHTSVLTGKEG